MDTNTKVFQDGILTMVINVLIEYFYVMPKFTRDDKYIWPSLVVVAAMGFFSVILANYLQSRIKEILDISIPISLIIIILLALYTFGANFE